jgi:hypothetical protein
MKNARVKIRLKKDLIVDATIKDTVIIAGETNYLCEMFDTQTSKRYLDIIHCSDVVEVLS